MEMCFPAACGENVAPLEQGTLVEKGLSWGSESVGIKPSLTQLMLWRRSKKPDWLLSALGCAGDTDRPILSQIILSACT